MELIQLAYLVTVVDERSFTRAAARLYVTQSTLSASLKRLEHELGVRLLDRGPHHLRLTDIGETFLVEARRTLAAAAAARDSVDLSLGELRGSLRLGIMQSLSTVDLAGLLAAFTAAHPRVHLAPSAPPGGSTGLIQGLQRGELDVAMAVSSPDVTGVSAQPLVREPLVLACPTGHEWATRTSISAPELSGGRFVELPTGWGLRTLTDRMFATASASREIVVEIPDPVTLFDLVGAGLGCAVVPRLTVPSTARITSVPIDDAGSFEIDLVLPANRPATAAAMAFAATAHAIINGGAPAT